VTPAHVPDSGQFDILYTFPGTGLAPVSDATQGYGDYNGGRWAVYEVSGFTVQPTNAADVVANAATIVDTGHRFVCPLIKIA